MIPTLTMPPTPDSLAALRTIAPAKINWTLEVLGRRPDGYHEIGSVMQTISLADEITLRPAAAFSLAIEGPESAGLDAEDNLVARAAHCYPDHLAAHPVTLSLVKHIPAAAGLGGGSSDAAATVRLLARHWGLHPADVQPTAAALGSDVAFFLRGGTQLAAGRGEQLRPLPAAPSQVLLLVTPPIALPDKTARLYAEIRPEHYTDVTATARLAAALERGASPDAGSYLNVFDAVADRVFPGLAEFRRAVERLTGSRAMLAGAGPSLFAFIDAARAAEQPWAADPWLARSGAKVRTVRTIGPDEATAILA